MAWKFDIRVRMKPAHGGQIPARLERYYWELNLMIHLLDGYTYGEMSGDNIGDAMDRFANQVDSIQNSELDTPVQAKSRLKGTLTAIKAVFNGSHPAFTMNDLYLQSVPPASRQLVVLLYDTFQQQMGDAKSFPGGTRPRVCMPFLEWQRNAAGFPPQAIMDDFIAHCGTDTLLDLIDMPSASLSVPKHTAIANAKAHGILVTRPPLRGPSTETIEFDNELQCTGGTCQPVPSGFCLTATDGSCSAMSG